MTGEWSPSKFLLELERASRFISPGRLLDHPNLWPVNVSRPDSNVGFLRAIAGLIIHHTRQAPWKPPLLYHSHLNPWPVGECSSSRFKCFFRSRAGTRQAPWEKCTLERYRQIPFARPFRANLSQRFPKPARFWLTARVRSLYAAPGRIQRKSGPEVKRKMGCSFAFVTSNFENRHLVELSLLWKDINWGGSWDNLCIYSFRKTSKKSFYSNKTSFALSIASLGFCTFQVSNFF